MGSRHFWGDQVIVASGGNEAVLDRGMLIVVTLLVQHQLGVVHIQGAGLVIKRRLSGE